MINILKEGGINWEWFTKFEQHSDNTVTILAHFRRHKGDEWEKELIQAKSHTKYYATQIWKEDKERIALEYFVPEIGWCKIRNPKYVFNYKGD